MHARNTNTLFVAEIYPIYFQPQHPRNQSRNNQVLPRHPHGLKHHAPRRISLNVRAHNLHHRKLSRPTNHFAGFTLSGPEVFYHHLRAFQNVGCQLAGVCRMPLRL